MKVLRILKCSCTQILDICSLSCSDIYRVTHPPIYLESWQDSWQQFVYIFYSKQSWIIWGRIWIWAIWGRQYNHQFMFLCLLYLVRTARFSSLSHPAHPYNPAYSPVRLLQHSSIILSVLLMFFYPLLKNPNLAAFWNAYLQFYILVLFFTLTSLEKGCNSLYAII